MNPGVELRSISLKPGNREAFHQLYSAQALLILKHWNFDVVSHGPLLHDKNSYYVIRCYDSLARREAPLALMEIYDDIGLEVDDITVQSLRKNSH